MVDIKRQGGASLFIALIMLLVITVLAVTSMRGVVLDNRISGLMRTNSILSNQAETAVTHIESRLQRLVEPLQACPNQDEICIDSEILGNFVAGTYVYKAEQPDTEMVNLASGIGQPSISSQWGVVPAPAGDLEGETINPHYGETIRGIGTFMYQVTGSASLSDEDKAHVRTVYAKDFSG